MKESSTGAKGAKASESAISEGLREKSNFSSKEMHKPGNEKSQRPKKGSDRI
jgi:hypothetical protein